MKLFVEDEATRFQGPDSGHVTVNDWWKDRTGRDLKDDLTCSLQLSNFDSSSYLIRAYDPQHEAENLFLLSYSPDGGSVSLLDNKDVVCIVTEYLHEYGDELFNAGKVIISKTEAEALNVNLEDFQPITPEQVWEKVWTTLDKPIDSHLFIGEDLHLKDREPILIVEMNSPTSEATAYEIVNGFGSMAGARRYAAAVREAAAEVGQTVVCRPLADVEYLDFEQYPVYEPLNCNTCPPARVAEELASALRYGSVQPDPSPAVDPYRIKPQKDAEAHAMRPYLKATFNLLKEAAQSHPDQRVTLPGEQYDLIVDVSQPVHGLEICPKGSTNPLVIYIPGQVLDVEEASLEDLQAINQGFAVKFKALQNQSQDKSQER